MAASGGVGLPAHGAPPRPAPKVAARPAPRPARPAMNPLLNPGQALSGNSLYQAAQGLAQAQTQPVIQQLAQEIAQNNQQTQGALKLTGGYFNQLGNQVNQSVADEQSIAGGLNNQLAQLQAGENSQLQGIGDNALASLAKYTGGAGAGVGAPGLASEIARQQGLAAQQQGAMRAFGATQGANYSSNAASNLGTFGMRGQEDLTKIAQAGQLKNVPLTQKIAQENSAYGADLATALGKLRQQQIANNISEAGLGIKAQQAATVAANDAATQRINAGKLGVAQGQLGVAQSRAKAAAQQQQFNNNPNAVGSPAWERVQKASGTQWSQNPNAVGSPAWARVQKQTAAGNGGVAKPLSTPENNTYWAKVSTIEQLIKDGQAKGGSAQQIQDGLTTGSNPSKTKFDAFQVRVAYELLGYGSIDQSTAAILHNQYGVRGGTYNGQPIKVTPNYSPNNPTQQPLPLGTPFSSNPFGGIGNAIGNAIGG